MKEDTKKRDTGRLLSLQLHLGRKAETERRSTRDLRWRRVCRHADMFTPQGSFEWILNKAESFSNFANITVFKYLIRDEIHIQKVGFPLFFVPSLRWSGAEHYKVKKRQQRNNLSALNTV